jgi:hypothetical protein
MRQRQHGVTHCSRVTRKPSGLLSFALAIACALAACGPRDAAYDTSTFHVHAAIAPQDVAVPSNAGSGSSEFNGLYTGSPDVFSCCWIAPHATLLVRKRGPASRLVAGFWIPDVARFAAAQHVAIAFAGIRAPPRRAQLEAGEQSTITIPVPRALRAASGLVPVTITSAIDYVPSRDAKPSRSLLSLLHLRAPQSNDDTRHLGAVLLYLYFD